MITSSRRVRGWSANRVQPPLLGFGEGENMPMRAPGERREVPRRGGRVLFHGSSAPDVIHSGILYRWCDLTNQSRASAKL